MSSLTNFGKSTGYHLIKPVDRDYYKSSIRKCGFHSKKLNKKQLVHNQPASTLTKRNLVQTLFPLLNMYIPLKRKLALIKWKTGFFSNEKSGSTEKQRALYY